MGFDFNTYQRQRARSRMIMAKERLGGRCVDCGTTNDLQFDHIDPATKLANVTEIGNWSLVRFLKEVDKCQLLCWQCHGRKTERDWPVVKPRIQVHGTGSKGIHGCSCELCKARRARYQRAYRAARKAASVGKVVEPVL